MGKKQQVCISELTTTSEMQQAPLPAKGAFHGGVALASLLMAAPASLAATSVIIWHYDLALWWALPLYPLIGTALTMFFGSLIWVLTRPIGPGGKSGYGTPPNGGRNPRAKRAELET